MILCVTQQVHTFNKLQTMNQITECDRLPEMLVFAQNLIKRVAWKSFSTTLKFFFFLQIVITWLSFVPSMNVLFTFSRIGKSDQ